MGDMFMSERKLLLEKEVQRIISLIKCETDESKIEQLKVRLETLMGSQYFCELCGNIQCKNAITQEAACEPMWNGLSM